MARRALQITGKNRIVLSPFFPDYLFFFFFFFFAILIVAKRHLGCRLNNLFI